MTRVRVYGTSKGNGSWTRVTRGVLDGLAACQLLAGFVPIDAYDSEESYPGHDAEVGLVIGPPVDGMGILRGMGWHKERLALIAPNSSWLPWRMLQTLKEQGATGLVSPSAWGKTVLEDHVKRLELDLPVSVYRHGVSEVFRPRVASYEALVASYTRGEFSVLHLASTTRARKGTSELLRAWQALEGSHGRPEHASLTIVIDATRDYVLRHAGCRLDDPSIQISSRLDLSEEDAAAFYRAHHVVCQPSRAEGFGLVPLEASACGVVTVATACTGHAEHVPSCDEIRDLGAKVPLTVEHGPDAPIDDGPGAMAPTVTEEAIRIALGKAYEGWPGYASSWRSMGATQGIFWSWPRRTRQWAEEMGWPKGES